MRCRVGFYTPPRHVLEYLVAAGGGGGGDTNSDDRSGGGGGAGGALFGVLQLPREAAVTVTVGAGGAGGSGDDGTDGANSVLSDLTAVGGGGGGRGGQNGRAGGSGGGGGGTTSGSTNGGAGTAGQGTAGLGTEGIAGGSGGNYPNFGLYSLITGTAFVYSLGGDYYGGSAAPNGGWGGGGGKFAGSGGIVVSGAGTSAVNGTYVISGTSFFDSPEYRLGSTTYYIRNNGANWNIVDGNTILYELNLTPIEPEAYNPYVGPLPQGPATAVNGDSPAPTIANATTTLAAEAGADGVVVIAYPDDMPALTVGNGLTFDQPTRAGYRVYRFTGGTGTVTFP